MFFEKVVDNEEWAAHHLINDCKRLEYAMKQIPLTRGLFALVDDIDFDTLLRYKWCATSGHKTFYAVRGVAVSRGKRRLEPMHRLILGPPPFDRAEVDHINGNGLDNQRINLRWCSKSENRRNEPKRLGYSNKYKGVRQRPGAKRKKFFAYIRHPETQKQIYLGSFVCEIEAAKAYNEAALKYHGSFASLNAI